MKYETLRKGLLERRKKTASANGKATWYKEERERLEKALNELEERYKKSNSSSQAEIESIDQMLAILDGLIDPVGVSLDSDHVGDANKMVADQNQQASASAMRKGDLSGTKADDSEPSPAFLKKPATEAA